MRAARLGLAASLLLLLASCSSKPKDLIVGKWEDSDGTSLVVEFASDGTVTLTDKRNQPVQGKYTFTGENQIGINESEGKIPKMTFKVAVSTKELTMTD